jgi:hypothetical protein
VNCIDSRAFDKSHSVWHSDDFSLLKTDGTEFKGGKEAWVSVAELFRPFTSHLHQPIYACCTETKYGYEMLAQAWILQTSQELRLWESKNTRMPRAKNGT